MICESRDCFDSLECSNLKLCRRRRGNMVVDSNDSELRPSSVNSNSNRKKSKRRPVKNVEPSLEGLGGKYGWIARGDKRPEEKRVPFTKPTIKQICSSLPFIWRYSFFWLKNFRQREKLFINTFQPLKHRPYYGVPCGGIGAGSIGRDFRGAFCKFSLRPGFVEQRTDSVKADQFILNVSQEGKTIKQIVLSSAFHHGESPLASWDFSFPPENVAYRGLYPRSWTKYALPELKLTIVVKQITPIIPHDYKDSSLPLSVFVFEVKNESDEIYDVSITFTFRNGTGKRRLADDVSCTVSEFEKNGIRGALLDHVIDQMNCIYGISGKESDSVKASVCTGFDPNGNGKVFWNTLIDNAGRIEGKLENCSNAVAVGLSSRILPNRNEKIEFSLVWHMPTVFFGTRQRPLKRWYTRHFGTEKDSAITISEYALQTYPEWEQKIEDWQNPILDHPNLPNWFKSALFNELYFLSDGGSVWFDYDQSWSQQEKHLSDYTEKLLMEYGRFGYLESWEYRMINTYDVHFYASFALAELFPQLEHVLQAEMTDNIHNTEDTLVKFHMEGDIAPIKTYRRVPHDLGNPAREPWVSTNAYVMHNTAMWKDLNLKYILASYRDYYCMLKKSRSFLEFIYPTVISLIQEGLENWDRDGDGMIENFGLADQTYDAWRMIGVSAYCGSLWIAALKVVVEMAKDYGDEKSYEKYLNILNGAKKVFDDKLWNGKYYNFDESLNSQKTVMADQLCGYWKHYYRAIGYMRPLCIWSMYSALRKNYKLLEKDTDLLAGIKIEDPVPNPLPVASADDVSSDSEVPVVDQELEVTVTVSDSDVKRSPSPVLMDQGTKIAICA
ncbi:hypothetical protein FO519_008616 [Halicephalobus sp. NKZ332]|nr:hypothetical protein FO519_008616 [Halicephalobus sp. NKZ332]